MKTRKARPARPPAATSPNLGHGGRGDREAQLRRRRSRRKARRDASLAIENVCATCGVAFKPRSTLGRPPLHCSTACRRAADNRIKRERSAAASAGAP
jgi:hypothetical protein